MKGGAMSDGVVEAVVLATTATAPGGLWRHLVDLGDGLRTRGIRVSVALPSSAAVLADEARGYDFAVVGLSSAEPRAVWHLHLADTFDRRGLGLMLRAR